MDCTHTHTQSHTHKHTHTHIYTQTHKQTHRHTLPPPHVLQVPSLFGHIFQPFILVTPPQKYLLLFNIYYTEKKEVMLYVCVCLCVCVYVCVSVCMYLSMCPISFLGGQALLGFI